MCVTAKEVTMKVKYALVAVAALALTACGGGAGGDPQALIGGSYVVTSITVDGRQVAVIDPVTISFAADSIAVDTPCNDMGGSITYTETRLEVGPLASTRMGCEPALMEQDQVIAAALSANPTWQVADGSLTLTGEGTTIVADSAADGAQP
jgi:heat shock protein HslJ